MFKAFKLKSLFLILKEKIIVAVKIYEKQQWLNGMNAHLKQKCINNIIQYYIKKYNIQSKF